MPRVTVIVPNYNHARFLSRRLSSIECQTYTDYEIILLDDCSSDNSRKILEEFAESKENVSYYFNETNSGSPFAQWNKGAKLARGEYLWIAESDDFADCNLLKKLVEKMDANPGAGIAYAQSVLVDEESKVISSYLKNLNFIYPDYNWEKDFVKDGKAACRQWLLFHNPIPNASGALFRKSIFEKAGYADPAMRLNGDWYLYARMLTMSDLAFVADELNFFRVHSQTQREKSRATFKVYDEILSINKYIKANIPAAAANADKAMEKIARWWTGSLPYQKLRKGVIKGNYRLYKIFRKHSSRLWLRILYNFVIVYLRTFLIWLGVLESAKKLRSVLFPGKYFMQ